MYVKPLLRMAGLTLLICFIAPLGFAENTLRVGIEAAYPLFASKAADVQITGFYNDIGNELCKQMQVSVNG